MSAIATEQQRMGEISTEERELRINLAAGYRLADKYGMSELIYTHISLRMPGQSQRICSTRTACSSVRSPRRAW
jgi:hypothetical protein